MEFLEGPVASLAVMGVIVLLCRWVFSTSARDARRDQRVPAAPRDLGLLVPVASVRTREDAEMLRTLLQESGVRATLSEDELEVQVLVFAKDADTARRLVSTP